MSEQSNFSKSLLSDTLKNLLRKSKLGKITVHQITENAHIHRNTFYYHFEDKIDLAKYMVRHEMDKEYPVDAKHTTDAVYRFYTLIYKEPIIYSNLFSSLTFDECVNFFYDEIREQVTFLITEKYATQHVPKEDLEYLIYWNSFPPAAGLAQSVLTEIKDANISSFPHRQLYPNLREIVVKASLDYYEAMAKASENH